MFNLVVFGSYVFCTFCAHCGNIPEKNIFGANSNCNETLCDPDSESGRKPNCVSVNDLLPEGVVLLENPRGDNKIDMDNLSRVCSSVFGTNNTQLSFFSGKNGESHFNIHLILTHVRI